MKKIIIIIVVAIAATVAVLALLRYASIPQEQEIVSVPVDASKTEQNTVIYSDSGFSPDQLIIKSGGTVFFENQSSKSMWTASGAHPSHRIYPTTGGCIGSTFDACQGIQPGDSWSFKFDIAGEWKYHNHLRPGDTGTIIVE
ncbi:MAG: hypothetical protein ACD_76C00122G0002 [uncultured bacterium]|nr:MAG: hypothetical protein ACD_76C00122G0002 [uncultured bacterium]HBD05323.1 hypothetical protein [Candidatus Uhrbacteria bacterium]